MGVQLKWRVGVFAGGELPTHTRQGTHNTFHRTLTQGSVANEGTGYVGSGKNARHQPHGGAGIFAVQGLAGRGEPVSTAAVDDHGRTLPVDPYAEAGNDLEGGLWVGRLRIVLDMRNPIGDSGEHRRTVGNRFVGRNGQAT